MRHGAAYLLLGVAAVACGRVAARQLSVSSESSDYSPVVRLFATVDVSDSIRVRVDSGVVRAAGLEAPGSAPALHTLAMRVVLAGPSGGRSTGAAVSRRPWQSLGETAWLPVADTLRLGQARAIAPARYTVARPHGLDARRAFLVFSIRGVLVERSARLAAGEPVGSARDVGPRAPRA